MKYYNYDTFLTEAAEAKDIPLVEYLLDGLKLMDPSHVEDAKRVFRKIFKDPEAKEVCAVFLDKIGVDEATAEAFFTRLMQNTSLPRSDMRVYLRHLGGAFAPCFINAICKGDLEIASLIYDGYQDKFPIQSDRPQSFGSYQISEYAETMSNLQSIGEVRQLFDLVVEAGLGDMLGKGDADTSCWEWLVSTNRLRDVIEMTDDVFYEGKLPRLQAGSVHDPELLAAFEHAKQRSLFPELYEHVFAWVADSELLDGEFEHTKIIPKHDFFTGFYDEHQEFKLSDFDFERVQQMKSSSRGRESQGMESLIGLTLGAQISCLDKKTSTLSKGLAKYLLPDDQKMGLNHPIGHTLCMVKTQWLSGFELCSPQANALSNADAFTRAFFPVQIFLDQRGAEHINVAKPVVLGEPNVYFYDAGRIFEMLGSDRHSNELKRVIPPAIWEQMYLRSAHTSISGKDLVLAKEHFGFTLGDWVGTVELKPEAIKELLVSGYSLWKDGEEKTRRQVSVNTKDLDGVQRTKIRLKAFESVIKMGGWPGNLPAIESVKEAVTKGVRLNDSTLQMAYLRAMGVEAVVPHISTKTQWDYFFRTFDNSEISPHLDQLPEHFHADVLATDLGL